MTVTIKDVAKATNTSISTVSKVINGKGFISEKTTELINNKIKELGFVPNKRAQNLARKSTKIIGFIMKVEENSAFNNPHIFEIMIGAQRALFKRNYSLNFVGIREDEDEIIRQIIENKSMDGILIHASAINSKIAKEIYESNFPHTIIGMPNFPNQLCWIDNNNKISGQLAAEHLLKIKCKRIAFIGGVRKDIVSEHRLDGARKVLLSNGLFIEEKLIYKVESTPEMGYESTISLMKENLPPDAIICANNNLVLGCTNALKNLNVKVPDEVAVITFDDYPFALITNPPTTAININVYDLGSQAAKNLIEKIKKPTLQFQTFATVPSLVIRESTLKNK